MATIERDVSLLQRRRVAPIYIVYGSAVQIQLNMIDYTIPENATVEFFAQCGSGPVYRCDGSAIGNSAVFTPPEGFFRQGDNALQLEINGRLIPLAIDVKCEERISGVGSEETPEQVRPLVLQAQDAAQEAGARASLSAGYAMSAGNSANAAAVSAESAGQSANAAAGSAESAAESANLANESETAAAESARVAQEAMEQTTATVVKTPYIGDNGNWYVYNYDTKAYADSGIRATGSQGPQGPQGKTGDPATLVSYVVEYLAGDSGTSVPSGSWSTTVPSVPQGQYLWTRVTQTYNTGSPVVSHSVSRMGVDGSGSVSSVAGVSPDSNGNVTLTAENVGARPDNWMPTAADLGALPSSGGTMTGPIAMGGNKVTGLGTPTDGTDAATKSYVDNTAMIAMAENLLDNSDFTSFIAQAGIGGKHGNQQYAGDRWILDSGTVTGDRSWMYCSFRNVCLNGTIRQILAAAPNTVTIGIEMVSGTAEISYMDGAVTITSNGGIIAHAWCYPGNYDGHPIPLYRAKGYAAELSVCKQYYQGNLAACTVGKVYGSTNGMITITLPRMRVVPTIEIKSILSQGWGDVRIDQLTPGWTNESESMIGQNYELSGDHVGKTIIVLFAASADL